MSRLRILHLEDEALDAKLIESRLQREGFECAITRVASQGDFARALVDEAYDAILADYSLPGFDGLSALKLVRARFSEIPFILVSGAIGEERAIEALTGGATDYVLKGQLDRLGAVLRRALREVAERNERLSAEESLRQSEERLRALADNVPGIVFSYVLHPNRRITTLYVSPRVGELLGPKSALEFSVELDLFRAQVHPEDRADFESARRSANAAGQRFDHEFRVRTDFGYRWIRELSRPTPVDDSHVRWDGILLDIQDHKATEFALRDSEASLFASKELAEAANRAKTVFLANMSHELRTPLNGVIGFTDLLMRNQDSLGPLTTKQEEALQTVSRSGKHLLDLISGVLDVAKVESGRMTLDSTSFSLSRLLRESIEIVKPAFEGKGITLAEEFGEVGQIVADEKKLRQVLLNLLSNACKFSPDGGAVRIEVASAPSEVVVTVSDMGIGISAQDQERIFEEFEQIETSYTRRFSGTGLGLSLAKTLVELHGGRIWIESKPGNGSRFSFSVPRHRAAADEVPEPNGHGDGSGSTPAEQTPLPPLHGKRILIVDDEEMNRLLLRRVLGISRCEIVEADSGESALRMARTHLPDVVLLDIQMPDKNGIDVLAELRSESATANIPAIAQTGFAYEDDQDQFLDAGFIGCVTKPFDVGTLAVDVQRMLDRHAAKVESE